MSLVWRGLELQPSHGRWRFWVNQGRDELPETRDYSDLIPFRRGRLHRPSTADRRVLEVKGYIQEATLAAFRAQADTMKGLLDPELAEPGLLVDTMEDGRLRWVAAVPRNILSAYGGNATRLMSIELEALDPYWYGSWGSLTLDAGYYLDAGWSLDDSAELIVVPTSLSHVVTVDVGGSADIDRVLVRFFGPSTASPGIENASIPDVVGFDVAGALPAPTPLHGVTSVELAVDNDARTVLLNGASKRSAMTLRAGNDNGEYFHLKSGLNELRILGKPASARIQFVPTYQ